jgi:citrate lyase beta subunit
VRINAAQTRDAADDLAAIGALAPGIRIPKVDPASRECESNQVDAV